ncbi:MFS transporter [Hoeflea sp. BAL378]|uniref:alpha-ketoacid dehydrogenase subunit alpha/beta n=1 Tax=Hoeflea sp. BAL378 TaxID=1547437 RepID=UPI000512FE7C|nr:alpha-ketoacid dehydrogenase subunit alpha/beta [Hoeflea sp. BAL378]KGF69466.1 MFS transporter [Hoeflea sp. BAL378]
MVTQMSISPAAPWFRIEVNESDWRDEQARDLVNWYGQMLLVRRFEEKLLDLEKAGLIHGPAHASIGQEACGVGAMSALGTHDKINGTHRAHHQVLTKLLNAELPEDFDISRDSFAEGMDTAIYRLMAEIMGLAPGYCGGRGGSMHMRHEDAGIVGTSAIIGGNPPHAVGYALADRMLGRDAISVTFFGDGAALAGTTYESMNIAAAQNLPVIFFIENNLYGVSTHIREVTRETRLSSRGAMLGIASIECDGMDVVAVHRAMLEARRIIGETGGPVVIEALCYRHLHQSGGRAGSDFGYRTREEEAEWKARDPISLARARLTLLGVLDEAAFSRIDSLVTERVAAAASRLTEPVPGGNALRIPDRLFPDPATVDEGIVGTLAEMKGARFLDHDQMHGRAVEKLKYVTAASETLAAAMDRDPTIIVMGEDAHQLRGGVSGFTKTALERFPERILPMPIAENGFTGIALGAALNGLRPVVEIMFGDFCFTAADQIVNGVGKVRHMFGGGFPVPLVLRVRISPHTGYGSQHSGDPSALFGMFPGWRIVMPTTAFDYIGLMNSALRCDDPVVLFEHVAFYQREYEVPAGDREFCIPFGSARVVRPGAACTILATSVMVQNAVDAAEESGVDAEIIDLRNLDHHGMDWETIGRSIKKTGNVIIAEQTARRLSMGATWCAEIQERFFDYLDHEILRVTGGLAAPTVSSPLNRAALGDADAIRDAMRRMCR